MCAEQTSPHRPSPRIGPSARARRQLWAVVLAGGEGRRLRPLIRRVLGDERPKQYAALVGSRSMLRHTVDRVAPVIPRDRTVVVTHRRHIMYVTKEFASGLMLHLLVQPEDRGTAAGILYPVHWIRWRDPEATVAVFPSDHFIVEEGLFMDHVLEVAAFVSRHPRWLVLLGAQPSGPETEYGWIEPGEPIGRTGTSPVWRVRRFWEKPSKETARTCFAGGHLWNTFVFVATVATLIEAGRQFLPELNDCLARIAPSKERSGESWAVQEAYARSPRADFSRAVLDPSPPFLAVSRLPALTWSDWGTPGRVLQTLQKAGLSPPWLKEFDRPRVASA
ncbi:MAG: NTP transferase domain-containing protein [Deltaproteobacteria bacterium]|nr:NTP transferase domain-containing protein [Deltaproteobacteria bacterium]